MDPASVPVSLVYLSVPVSTVFWLTYNIPLMVLLSCLLWAAVFRINDINDGGCVNTTHAIPAVSSVFTIEPEGCILRVFYGFHAAPRLILGFMYLSYYRARLDHVTHKTLVQLLTSTWFVLYMVESVSLMGVFSVTEINLHYFVVHLFGATSYFTMAIHTVLYKLSRFKNVTDMEKKSFFWKKAVLATETSSAMLLVLCFYYLHRVYCLPGAYSAFALCEYVIVCCNVAYHYTATWDFSRQNIMAARVHHDVAGTNGFKQKVNGATKRHF